MCPLGGYMEGDSTPKFCMMLQNDGLTFFARDCYNTGPQSLHYIAMGAREKDQEDYAGVIDILPLLGDELLAWIAKAWEFSYLPVRVSSAPRSCI